MSYNLLKGKRGIIFGALNDQSIAWKVAEKAVEEGATITLSNTPMAIRMGEVNALAEKLNCEIIPADATIRSGCLLMCVRNVRMTTLITECWRKHWISLLFLSIK